MYTYKYAWSLLVYFSHFFLDEASLNVNVARNGNILVTSVVVLVVVEE